MSTSSKPSPPSAMGITEVWQEGFMLLIPFSAAFPASAEVRQPLNESKMCIRDRIWRMLLENLLGMICRCLSLYQNRLDVYKRQDVLITATKGKYITLSAHGPLMKMAKTHYGLSGLSLIHIWVSRPLYRYLYLHLLFQTLQNTSRYAFDADWNAPLPIILMIPLLR